jgi:valyl-tRNA synthetase
MKTELATIYDPRAIEPEIYRLWLDQHVFDADPDGGGAPKFCMVIPPPNVTAELHVGHALNNTLQDVLIRFRRMNQFNTLWMPGTDHAGIATQTVVEKRILAEERRKRTDFDRREFVERIQAWKDEYEARIIQQLKQIGCSCDWRRTRFTMDEVCAAAVREAFFRLFSDGLIYRGKRLVNWDPATQTVLADDEVEYETVQGHFWYLRYPLAEPVRVEGKTITHVTVATTRPETMLGDTAVAINPRDPRAAALVGRMVRLPLVGRLIPIIADEHVVLPDPASDDEKARFSTGFLKVTPAHDPDDWAIGQRHGLPVVNVMAPDGTISDRFGWTDATSADSQQLLGMDRFEAREAIVEWFRKEHLLEDVQPYTHEVGHSYRSHVPIEPYLSDQWYIAVKKPIDKPDVIERFGQGLIDGTDVPRNSLAGMALAPLLDGRVKFTPDRYARSYRSWLENLRDWPISRQLWWGHQIPVWSASGEKLKVNWRPEGYDSESIQVPSHVKGHPDVPLGFQTQTVDGEHVHYLCVPPGHPEVESTLEQLGFTRDEDVLDTWFSSALWPFSTLKWPSREDEDQALLKTFYPGDVLCTAREIITLWVSRMVMMGQYCVGDIPFSDVFIHAMIQDGEGRKMSKSLGNGIDPLDIVDSHGADALRFTLVSMTTQTQDVRLPVEEMKLPDGRTAHTSPRFDIGRNFCNKLWNASRFILMNLGGQPAWSDIRPHAHLADVWILSRLNATIRDATAAVEEYRFNELADTLYHFMWDDLCDWYLEIAKARINAGQAAPKAILAACLDMTLRLLHPVVPFITEAIWQRLNQAAPVRGSGDQKAPPILAQAQWPRANAECIAPPAEQDFALLQDLVRQIRNARTEHNVPPGRKADVLVEARGRQAQLISDNAALMAGLANLGQVRVVDETAGPPAGAAALTAAGVRLFVLGIIDPRAEIQRLGKQKATLDRGIAGIEGKLANAGFLAKAPAQVVAAERHRLEALRRDLEAVEAALAALKP